MMGISGAFSSLGINERATPNSGGNIKVPKNFSTMSLPNLVSATGHTIIPSFVRNNYCDDELESSDQPIDFSKKYCESKMGPVDKVIEPPHGGRCTFNKVVKSYNNTFTMYAETDLDQPTDYSLRYAEDDSDSEDCTKISKTETTEFVQDTIKTYCTEDTPYETPFNFSTSTSMSDLRIDDKASKEVKNDTVKDKIVKSGFSSGLMSPEKPVNYCEEGTPGYFSRVDSCGSLNSIPVSDPPKQQLKEENLVKVSDKEPRKNGKFPSETKAVKFEEVVNYAEETPLMFSRSSSLASLDSIEQHSIHDDRSSVVSDFSRLTSGLISPSELPDSPSQTVPPSPKPRKNPIVFAQVVKTKTEETPTVENVPKSSVFEDVVKKFKMESTPLQFSTATSLSSLIDDHEELSKAAHIQHTEDISVNKDDKNVLDITNELSEGSEDEDILAACINIGMQNNRYSQPKSSTPPPNEVPTYKFSQHGDNSAPQHLSVTNLMPNVQKSDITSDSLRTYCTEDTPAILSQAGSNSDLSILSLQVDAKIRVEKNSGSEDIAEQVQNLKISDLEDGPSSIERRDDLNTSLEIEPNEDHNSRRSSFSFLSDASHESEQALLQECILAGMPKSTSTVPIEKSTDLAPPDDTILNFSKNESSDDEDEDILADCINIGMKNNRYSQQKLNACNNNFKCPPPVTKPSSKNSKPEVVHDSIKSYYTEDTPAVLSNAGSHSDLSVLSMQGTENGGGKDYLSDLNSNFSDDDDDDDERLLAECVRYGMAKISGAAMTQEPNMNQNCDGATKNYLQASPAKVDANQKEPPEGNKNFVEHPTHNLPPDLNLSLENNASDDSRSVSSISDDSYASEQALLQECILAGMPKRPPPPEPAPDSAELTAAEKALLHQCILEGMKKCRIAPKKAEEDDDTAELTEAEQALLRQCILSGMPKNKNLTLGGPSGSREATELTESERALLQQCILAGMPKSRNGASRQWPRRPREQAEHSCCIHCPRNGANRAAFRQSHVKPRRRYRQVRETRDVNILYVTSQILAMKKEIVDRSHEEWV